MVHFEIPVNDIERAINFYKKIFDWHIEKVDMPKEGATEGEPYYMVRTTEVDENNMSKEQGAINGGLMKRISPAQAFMNYVSVASIDKTLADIQANGGTVKMPKTEIGSGMGWIAAFQDTEDNVVGIHEKNNHQKK